MQLSSPRMQEIWRKVESFSLDDPASRLTFTRRLARENGWSLGYAVRVVDQYKRFMFLTLAAGHPVTPSEDVDQAWHLHLCYTQSYWQDFCEGVLERPIHHGPTRGQPGEQEHFHDQYIRTMASYAAVFGEPPPADIWPPAEQRFDADLHWQRVNLRRNWVIPKPRLPGWIKRPLSRQQPAAEKPPNVAAAAALMAGLPLTIGMVNPLDLAGPSFLMFFALVAVMALAAGAFVRWFLLSRDNTVDVTLDDIEPLHLALLTDQGRLRFAQAGMAALASEGTATIHEEQTKLLGFLPLATTQTYQVSPTLSPNSASSMQKLHRRLSAMGTAQLPEAIKEAVAVAEEEEDELKRRGLLTSDWFSSAALWLPLMFPALVLALGVVKIMVGIQRERPVAFLVIGCIVLGVIALFVCGRQPRRTRAGDRLLQDAIATYKGMEQSPGGELQADTVALSVGLFGTGLLAGTTLDLLHRSWPQSSHWGGGGCGGGGCGGGGCGGGGCGGCGGCGG